MLRKILFLFLALAASCVAHTQCVNPVTLTAGFELPFAFPNQAMTVKPDKSGRDFMYVAGKEQGLLIYDISNINSPSHVHTFPKQDFMNMDVMNITQDGNFLYLALGNHFNTTTDYPGMAIIDVADPAQAAITDVWQHTTYRNGAGIVGVEGNYAYLGAMELGLIILDITDKNNISFVSQFIPDISFPNPNNPDPQKFNARGMTVKDDVVYLCYDAGGLRIINVADKQNPVETGRYSNPLLFNRPRAYNNIVLDDTLVYIAIDYCGMEVLNVSDTSNITQVGWWNPWACETPANTWFNSPGHTNEIEFDENCKLLFMSTGRGDGHVVNVSNPAQPDSCNRFGGTSDNQGTWGIGLRGDKIFAGYIFVPLGIPFFSNWGGVKLFTWSSACSTGIETTENTDEFYVFPNPAADEINIYITKNTGKTNILISDVTGKIVFSVLSEYDDMLKIPVSFFANGMYSVIAQSNKGTEYSRFVVMK